MSIVLKKGNGILYFIIAVLVLAVGAGAFFMVQKDAPAVAPGGTDFSSNSSVLGQVEQPASEPSGGSVLGLDKKSDDGAGEPVESVLDASEAKVNVGKKDKEEEKPEEPRVSSIVQKMIDSIAAYYAADSIESKLACVIDPEKVKPKMEKYYSKEGVKPAKVARINVPVGMALGGYAYWRAQGSLEDGTPFFVALRMIDGKPKIDWESEVRYSDFDWDEWVEDPAAQAGEFRVYAKIDGVYEAPFEDSSRYRCLHLKTMGSSRTIFAYLDMNDFDQKEFFDAIVGANGGPLECLLKLDKTKVKEKAKGKTKAKGKSKEDNPSAVLTAKVLKVLSPSWINPGTSDE